VAIPLRVVHTSTIASAGLWPLTASPQAGRAQYRPGEERGGDKRQQREDALADPGDRIAPPELPGLSLEQVDVGAHRPPSCAARPRMC
jgi:hypothetical protein